MVLYRILSILLSPLIDFYLFIRKNKAKEDKARFAERLGYASVNRPQGKLIWVHCASVGESNSVWPLINKILENNSKANILFTSGTVTSAEQIAKKLPNRVIHQFVPVDKYFAVKRFIKHWKPDFAMFVESELWPNLIYETKKSGCRLALVNARISQKSFKRWQFFKKIGFNIFDNFSICFAQSKQDLERFQALGLKNSHYLGNLKTVCPDPKINSDKLAEFSAATLGRKIWLAASTHAGEEQIVIRVHKELRKHFPNLLTVIAPRHPNRLHEIMQLFPNDFNAAVRSLSQQINGSTEFYIANTLGELSLFYKACQVALIGGSMLDNIGGHNPYEAIKAGCVAVSGIYVANFSEIYEDLVKNNACVMVKNEDELTKALIELLNDNKHINDVCQAASLHAFGQLEALDKIAGAILKLI